MNLRKLPKEGELLDIALRRGRKEAGKIGKQSSSHKLKKAREIRRVEVAGNYVIRALEETVKEFPSIRNMSPFYREMVEAIIDAGKVKKALGHFEVVAKVVRKLRREHLIGIKKQGKGNEAKIGEKSRQFVGRLASAVKSLGKSIAVYNNAAERLRELPNIKEMPTAIIAGCPNAGKSTLLGKVSGSTPKIAAYPFTTQRLEMGYFKERYRDVQLVDTPGLLDSELDKMNAIERKGIAALKHLASLIIFVVDPTEKCGFSLEKQLRLLNAIAKEFGKEKVVVYLSKEDIAGKQQLERAREQLKDFKFLNGKKQGLQSSIADRLLEN